MWGLLRKTTTALIGWKLSRETNYKLFNESILSLCVFLHMGICMYIYAFTCGTCVYKDTWKHRGQSSIPGAVLPQKISLFCAMKSLTGLEPAQRQGYLLVNFKKIIMPICIPISFEVKLYFQSSKLTLFITSFWT